MSKPLDIIILWHMHQPYYRDPVKGEYLLPWTYLHGVKDYYDMAAIVEETPGAKVVFNLVPSLLEQIGDYAAGEARDPLLLRAAMEPADMSEADRLYVLENFFSANRQRMIEPLPRFLELLCLAGEEGGAGRRDRLRLFGDQEILDLQVCFLLAWTGEMVRRRYPQVRELIRKGKGFSPSDRAGLLAVHREVLSAIIPLYRSLHLSGKAELSVTPAFHPILPLLCDLRSALSAMPKATIPTTPFSHPEDARAQVRMAVEQFTGIFGFAPQGMWPSEGAVSDEALEVMAGAGMDWGATDEGVLLRSLQGGLGPGREALYQPYTYHARSGDLGLFFRDHALSDLIGFTYSQWDGERAVADFVNRLRTVRSDAPGATVVSVILDGENAWEYYADNGYGFLSGLYRAIDGASGLRLATCSEVLERNPSRPGLGKIHAGSWINASYGIWIGHPEENRAWELLARARTAACEASPDCAAVLAGALSLEAVPSRVRTACLSLYAAEGSDWFWWYGDDHFSPHSDRFDFLFRRHLSNVYDQLGLAVPHELNEPIKSRRPAGAVREPTSLISPLVNGNVTDYFEWLGAGLFDLSRLGSAMHAAGGLLHSLFYGFDRRNFYLRLDGDNSLDRILLPEDRIDVNLVHSGEFRFIMDMAGTEGPILQRQGGKWLPTGSSFCWKVARVCEMAIPLVALGVNPRDRLFATVTISRGGQEVGRWPMDAPMVMLYAGPELELENWLI